MAKLQAIIGGLQKHVSDGQFTSGTVAYTTAILVPLFQSWIDAINAVAAAQANAKDAVTAMRGVAAKIGPVYLALKQHLLLTYGTANQTLTDYGLKPRKASTPKTIEQKAAAAAKAKATREARGTGSKKSKSTVTGNVVGVEITPKTVVPVEPSPSAQPAPVATGVPTPGTSK